MAGMMTRLGGWATKGVDYLGTRGWSGSEAVRHRKILESKMIQNEAGKMVDATEDQISDARRAIKSRGMRRSAYIGAGGLFMMGRGGPSGSSSGSTGLTPHSSGGATM